jgi:hypothetical protein
MDISRAERIAKLAETTKKLADTVKKPSGANAKPVAPAAAAVVPKVPVQVPAGVAPLPPSLPGTWFIQILMYLVAGFLAIALILLAVDQWITPIFQRVPGGQGYIPIPGADKTLVYWTTKNEIANVIVGPSPPPPTTRTPGTAQPQTLYSPVIEGQANYSITMDVYIDDAYPQTLTGANPRRIFYSSGPSLTSPSMIAWLDNTKNTAYVTSFTTETPSQEETVIFENVPVHTPFRIGIVKTPYIVEGYLNGLLVMTRQLRASTSRPKLNDIIFAPANIIDSNNVVLSKGIEVMNLRTFGYSASSSEMKGRMSDLMTKTDFKPIVTTKY